MGTDSLKLSKRVYRSEKDFKDLKKSWNELVDFAGADVFQLHEWQYSWWNMFRADNELFIVTYWLKDKLIALLPFFIQKKKFSRLRFVKTLQLIGSHITTAEDGLLPVGKAFGGYLDIIVHPEHFDLISQEIPGLFKELIQSVNQISLDEIPEHSLLMHCLPSFQESDKWTLKHSEASKCSQCLIGLGWDRYLSTLSKSTRKNIRRGLRNVYDDEVFEVHEAKTEEKFELIFDELVRLHQSRWHKQDMPGIFADHRMEYFFRSTISNLFRNGLASIHWAEKNQRIIAVELTCHYNHTIYTLQGGYDIDSEFTKYSPSNLIIYHMMKTGVENGYLVFDWLRGSEKYKSSTSNLVLQNHKLTLTAKNRLSGLKFFITETSTDLLTRSQNERLVLSVYFENYTFLNALKKYIRRLITHNRID
ncbi:MAG: GNAT family N-acetyltransferase [Gracilimonas sp.]|nr:GNAT family N-acetyltransferase [Gracilimonas sp.]